MGMGQVVQWVTVGVAGCSLLVSVIALYKNHRTQARMTAIEEARERDRVVDKGRAILRAELLVGELSSSYGARHWFPAFTYDLVIMNVGKSEARNITVFLDEKPLLEHGAIPPGVGETRLLGPESECKYPLRSRARSIEITWEDDSGIPGRFRTQFSARRE